MRAFLEVQVRRTPKEGLNNSIHEWLRRREYGAGPDSLTPDQASSCQIRERAVQARGKLQ